MQASTDVPWSIAMTTWQSYTGRLSLQDHARLRLALRDALEAGQRLSDLTASDGSVTAIRDHLDCAIERLDTVRRLLQDCPSE